MSKTTSNTEQAQPAALLGLAALRETLAADNPSFKAALSAEGDAERFCSNVRKELREKRKSLGIDQEKMGRRLNLSQSAISKIEGGRGDIGMKTLHRYARALGLQPVLGYVPTVDAMKATMPSGGFEPAMVAVEVGSTVAAAMLTAAFDIQVDAQRALMRRVYHTIAQITEEKEKEPA
jgi:transcriptional regulator with XRE-family HTH domain